METCCEREIRQRILNEMIIDVEKSIQQFRRTLEGLQVRIETEERQRDLLVQKRNALVHMLETEVSIADFVAKVLCERGEPMRVQEIVRALLENGITSSSGEAPVNSVLSAVSRRADLFVRVSRGLYTLRQDNSISRHHNTACRSHAAASS
jgi:hypothetical protein